MELIAFDNFVFADNDYWTGIADANRLGNWSPMPNYATRQGAAPLLTGGTLSERTLPAQIGYEGSSAIESALLTALGRLDPTNMTPRTLTAELNDGTEVTCQAIVIFDTFGFSADGDVNVLNVSFVAADPIWRDVDGTTLPTATFLSESQGLAVVNDGNAPVWPTIILLPETARSSTSAAVGWRYHRTLSIENATSRDWHKQIVYADLGDTSAWVTGGKARSDGSDLRVFQDGRQLYRALIGWNTTLTVIAVEVSCPASGLITLEVLYGNANGTGDDPYNLNNATITTALGVVPTYPNAWTPINLENAIGTASGGGANTMTGITGGDDKWRGGYIAIYGGTGATQFRKISTFAAGVATVTRNWTTNPDATSKYIVWQSGAHVDGGRASAGAASTLTDASQAWATNEWENATLTLQSGTGSGQTATVLSNTATVLTISGTWGTNPDNTTGYRIKRLGTHDYFVDSTADLVTLSQNNHGAWMASPTRPNPSIIRYGDKVPGGWAPALYLANNDDVAQSRSRSGTSDDSGVLRARRSKQHTHGYPGQGAADGVAGYFPIGLQGTYFDYRLGNINGQGKFVFAVQGSGGEDWSNVVEDSTTHATITTVAAAYKHLTDYGSPSRLGFFILPADDISFDGAANDDESEIRWNTVLKLHYDQDGIAVSAIGAETEIYDLQYSLWIGGGVGHDLYPHTRVDIGGITNGRAIFPQLATEYLEIVSHPDQTEAPVAGLYVASSLRPTNRTPYALEIVTVTLDQDGNEIEQVDPLAFRIAPGSQLLTNPSADSNTTGWAITFTDAAINATLSRHGGATFFGDTTGSFLVTVSVNALVGLHQHAVTVEGQPFAVSPGLYADIQTDMVKEIAVAWHGRTTTANLEPCVILHFYSDAAGTVECDGGPKTTEPLDWSPASGTWYSRVSSTGNAASGYSAPSDAVSARVELRVYSNLNGATGSIYFDDMYVGFPILYATDARATGQGDTALAVGMRKGWIG